MQTDKQMTNWQDNFDKLKHHIKNTSIAHYDDKGVNIGFLKAEDVFRYFIQQTIDKAVAQRDEECQKTVDDLWSVINNLKGNND